VTLVPGSTGASATRPPQRSGTRLRRIPDQSPSLTTPHSNFQRSTALVSNARASPLVELLPNAQRRTLRTARREHGQSGPPRNDPQAAAGK